MIEDKCTYFRHSSTISLWALKLVEAIAHLIGKNDKFGVTDDLATPYLS